MNEKEYLEFRVEDQINWYSTKSTDCQNKYKFCKVIEIVSAAIIPFLAGMGEKVCGGQVLIGILGVTIATSAAISSIFKYHENWIQYRATSEALKHEKYLFVSSSEPYCGEEKVNTFVQRIESLISKENSSWVQTFKSQAKVSSKG